MEIDEDALERACYNAMRRREREISDCNAKQAKYFHEQEELRDKQQAQYFREQATKPIVVISAQEPQHKKRDWVSWLKRK